MATKKPVAKPSMSEAGYVNPSAGTSDPSDMAVWFETELVPDLKWPLCLNVYRRMPREDSRVWSVLSAIKLPIRRTAWFIDPNGADDEVVKFVAANLGLPIRGDGGGDSDQTGAAKKKLATKGFQQGRFNFGEYLNEALSNLRYGHAVFEQVYCDARTVMPGTLGNGRVALRKLAARPQSTIAKWNVARDGGLVSIEQDPPAGSGFALMGANVVVPIKNLVIHRNEPEPGLWIGNSLLRPSYKHWILKDELMRIEAAAARRNGLGLPVFTTAPEDSGDQTKVDAYGDMARRATASSQSGIGLPYGAKAELMGVQGNLPDLRLAIEYHDRMIAVAGLAHHLNLDGKGGSYALASVQGDTFTQADNAIMFSFVDEANAYVMEDLVLANFGQDRGLPLISPDEVGSRQDATAAAIALLIQAEALTPDAALEAWIRQQLGVPPLEYSPPSPTPDEANDEGDDPASSPPAGIPGNMALNLPERPA